MAKKVEPVLAALSAQELNEERLLQLRNVTGVGTGYRFKNGKMTKEVTVQVLVDKKMPPESLGSADIVPESLEGPGGTVGTDVLEVKFEAYQDTGRYRPVPAGVSIGPEATVSAGTLGGWACDNTDDTIVLLSNNHVISNLDTMPALRRIVQPGRFDGGVLPGDVIGRLKRHIQVNTIPNPPVPPGALPATSVVDAAIGTIDVNFTYNLRQLNVPVIYEIQAAALGLKVQKRGRTTTFTKNGTITSINVTITITYRGQTRLGRIQNSFIISSTDGNVFSGPGDSGSLILNQAAGVLDGTFPVVGLLYGGGIQNGTPVTIANDINAVFGALNLETVCVCIARALIRAIFGWLGSFEIPRNELGRIPTIGEWGWQLGGRYMLMHKERQLRRFRDHLRGAGKFGAGIEELIRKETARVGQIIAEDEEAFGLLVEALRPFVVKPTIKDILDTRLDRKTLKNLLAFSSRVGRSKEIRSQLVFVKEVAKTVEGMKLRDVLRSADLSAAGSKQR